MLDECAAAISYGDGRELWTFQPNNQLVNAVGLRCAGVQEDATVVLMDCDAALTPNDGRSRWEMLGSGQLKSARVGDFCLTQVGLAPGFANVAAKAAAAASSTLSSAHGMLLPRAELRARICRGVGGGCLGGGGKADLCVAGRCVHGC